MGNIAETVKKQTDRILRQRALNLTEGVVVSGVSSGTGAPAPVVNNPPADLTAHKASADHDGRYYTESEIDGMLNFLGLSDTPAAYTGEGGKIVAVNADVSGLEFVTAPPAENGIPTGGANNQLLAKDGATDYAVKWVEAPEAANGLPAGGTAGKVLAKIDGADYNAQWVVPQPVFIWDATETIEGIDRTSTSKATYTSMTAIIDVYKPIKITHVYWDIKTAGTYTLKMYGSAIADDVSVALDDQADVDFELTEPLILIPGNYKMWLHCDTSVIIDYNNAADYFGTFWEQSSALTNGSANNVLMPIKIKAYIGAWND
jgi:hypothetical protein